MRRDEQVPDLSHYLTIGNAILIMSFKYVKQTILPLM